MTDDMTPTQHDTPVAEEAAPASARGKGAPQPEPQEGDVADAASAGVASEGADAPPEAADPLEQAQAEVARLRDQLLRTAADFDNFRKRTRRETSDAERRAREELLRDLLPVFDNLERAAAHASGATDVKALVDGLDMVMRQFSDTLAKLGVQRVQAVGTAFDPALHEALQQMETPDFEPGCVMTEIQAGYKMGDRLVRPALVVVAKRPMATS